MLFNSTIKCCPRRFVWSEFGKGKYRRTECKAVIACFESISMQHMLPAKQSFYYKQNNMKRNGKAQHIKR